MSQKVKKFLVFFALFTVFSGPGFLIGNIIGKEMAHRQNQGYGSSWTLLDSPLKFKKIVEATSRNVWAQIHNGKLYYFSFRCYYQDNCNQWIETQDVPDNIHSGLESGKMNEGTTCPFAENFKYFKNPAGNIVKCVRALSYGMDIVPGWIVYYALTDDGKIWGWSFSSSMLDEVIYPVLCSCSGFLLGIAAFIIFFRKGTKMMKTKSQE